MATAIHRLVEACRAGRHPALIARLASGWWILGEQQVLPGYSLLLPDPVVPHLNALDAGARARFLADMALAGDVLMSTCAALRVNYAMFGNVEPVLHAHLFPRRDDEPQAQRQLQPWALDWNKAPRYEEGKHGALRGALAEELTRRQTA